MPAFAILMLLAAAVALLGLGALGILFGTVLLLLPNRDGFLQSRLGAFALSGGCACAIIGISVAAAYLP